MCKDKLSQYIFNASNEDGYMDLQGYDNTQQLLIGKLQ